MGRPCIVQDTGFSRILPDGNGLLAFRTVEEAAEVIAEVDNRYEHHCRAARKLAEEFFESRNVLQRLIEMAITKA
jgi:hypothetical protein